eukprot:967952_1
MATTNSDDMLQMETNVSVQKMLSKLGDNFPEQERVVLSMKVIKINRRKKEQNRVLLLTEKALYNLKPNDLRKCQRRVDITKIVSITTSTVSNEMVLHIPEEYDYRYKSNHKDRIIHVLSTIFHRNEGKKMGIAQSHQSSLQSAVYTKYRGCQLTREERLQRYRELIGKDNYQDEIDDINTAKNTALLQPSNDQITPNDFELLTLVGRNAFGKVMQVRKKNTNTIYAMKILKKRALIQKGKSHVQQVKNERKILQSLDHPFLMKLRYAFQTHSKLYFVLDYYRGGELFLHLKKKRRFSEKEAQMLIAESGMALAHLHSLDIVYRNLNPENILLDDAGHICLTHFGSSKDLGKQDINDSFDGTPEYLSPEIILGSDHGKPVDWWCLGVLLYELTVGIPPFYSQKISEMYRKIQEDPLIFPPHLSNACKDLISKLLVKDPNERLGVTGGFEDIMRHSFFGNIDWNKLYEKSIDLPYKPLVKTVDQELHEQRCIDDTLFHEPIVDTPTTPPTFIDSALKERQKEHEFSGWLYAHKNNNMSSGASYTSIL